MQARSSARRRRLRIIKGCLLIIQSHASRRRAKARQFDNVEQVHLHEQNRPA
jgi:hypothetical protein